MLNIIRAILVKGKGKRVMCIVTYNIIRWEGQRCPIYCTCLKARHRRIGHSPDRRFMWLKKGQPPSSA
jgi:hypothetical protein